MLTLPSTPRGVQYNQEACRRSHLQVYPVAKLRDDSLDHYWKTKMKSFHWQCANARRGWRVIIGIVSLRRWWWRFIIGICNLCGTPFANNGGIFDMTRCNTLRVCMLIMPWAWDDLPHCRTPARSTLGSGRIHDIVEALCFPWSRPDCCWCRPNNSYIIVYVIVNE